MTVEVDRAMEQIYEFMENRDDCQFSFEELASAVTEDYVPNTKTIRKRLEQHYGNTIIISQNSRGLPAVCFRGTGENLLMDAWNSQQIQGSEEEERLRLVRAAAAIILEDISSQVQNCESFLYLLV